MNEDQGRPLTRKAYREQQSKNQGWRKLAEWKADRSNEQDSQIDLHSHDTNLDQEPLISRSRKRNVEEAPQDELVEGQPLTREQSLANDKMTLAEEKTQRLKTKLNRVILGLVVLIVIVYLILFFIG
ncbi:hypothetical protein [Limosilactobacillus caecicola]|uniref:hypothetical protein n=1 Tax=Limosilactobacillus caecicola TaxID=2941332 RepID=UPI00203B4ECF|nr:hypothetical protein [Limosilactobacillus caecicola]